MCLTACATPEPITVNKCEVPEAFLANTETPDITGIRTNADLVLVVQAAMAAVTMCNADKQRIFRFFGATSK